MAKVYLKKKCSPSLEIMEVHIETTLRFHLTPVRTAKFNKWWTTRQQILDEVWKKGKPYPLLKGL